MRKTKIAIGIALSLLAIGCTNGDDGATATEQCKIAIAVDAATTTTRTAVDEPDDKLNGKQHVTRVQIYIYEKSDDDFTCVTNEDIGWHHLEGAADGLDTRRQQYVTLYQDYKDDTEYRFLAIGFDDTFTGDATLPTFNNANSVEAYGNPSNIAKEGDKLSEGMFALQEGKDVSLIARSEIFAGAKTFTKAQLKDGTAANTFIELYRRVAGVKGYFKSLPKTIEGKTVAKVELRLYDGQNTKAYFLPLLPDGYSTAKDVSDDEYIDYVTSPSTGDNGSVIASYTASDEATFILSAYMLPSKGSTSEDNPGVSTLALYLVDADGNELTSRHIVYRESSQTRSGTGIIDEPDETGDSPYYHYPIRANQFYRIGSKDVPIDLSGSSSVIYIDIDPVWDEYYGGAMDNTTSGGINIDKTWGEHNGGAISD